ncbi:MAG: aromatic ring-hydroxylating dioxygenase subunit alpha [Actinomycetota bacterium]
MTAFVHRHALRRCWFPVCESPDVADSPVAVRLLGHDLVLWRTASGIGVAPDRCPHREAPLSIGSIEDGTLTCAYHGWGFGPDGRCVSVPSSGPGAATPPTANLRCGRVEERYGLVWVCLDEPATTIPEIAQDADPAFWRANTGVETWSVSTPRMVDNFLDISHFPWVHLGTFGGAQDPVVAHLELGELAGGFVGYRYEVDAANPGAAAATSGSDAAVVRRTMSTGFHLPFSVRSTIAYEGGLEHILLLLSTPVDDVESLFTFVVWRNDERPADQEDIIAFDRAIGAEDKAMLEQIPGTLPLQRTGVVNVQSDKPSVEWRRRFTELLDTEAT